MKKRTKVSNGISWFSRFAKWSVRQTARPLSFVLASGLIAEELDEEMLDKFRAQYEKLALNLRRAIDNGGVDIGTPEIKNLGKEPNT